MDQVMRSPTIQARGQSKCSEDTWIVTSPCFVPPQSSAKAKSSPVPIHCKSVEYIEGTDRNPALFPPSIIDLHQEQGPWWRIPRRLEAWHEKGEAKTDLDSA